MVFGTLAEAAIVNAGILIYVAASVAGAPMPQGPEPAGAMVPASIGAPHQCDENRYPVSALQTGTEGDTTLAFKITPGGEVKDATVLSSSGNTDLDSASVACASDWKYRPALRDGAPVEVPWRAMVRWKIGISEPFVDIAHEAYECITATEAGREELREATLHPVVRVHFSNGAVASASLLASSGNPDFDERARACYASLPKEATANLGGELNETFVVMLGSWW
jgi:TonB family protein